MFPLTLFAKYLIYVWWCRVGLRDLIVDAKVSELTSFKYGLVKLGLGLVFSLPIGTTLSILGVMYYPQYRFIAYYSFSFVILHYIEWLIMKQVLMKGRIPSPTRSIAYYWIVVGSVYSTLTDVLASKYGPTIYLADYIGTKNIF